MTNGHQYTVVVGVDGSPSSKAALRWALWHADGVSGRILAMQAWDVPLIYHWEAAGLEDPATTTAKELRATVDEVAEATSVPIENTVAQGHAARSLVDLTRSSSADLLVVGNRGHGGFTEALLGSVGQYCVHHAPCPVLVLRGHATA